MPTTVSPTIVTTRINPAKNVAFIGEREMLALLFAKRGATMLSFVAQTDPKPLKKSRTDGTPTPWSSLIKVAKVNGVVNFHYDEGVIRRLAKEGKSDSDFRKGSSFHQPILTEDGKLTPFAIHKADAAAVVGWHTIVQKKDNSGPNVVDSTANDFTIDDLLKSPTARIYIRFQLKSAIDSEYMGDGKTLTYEDVKNYIPLPSSYDNQGLDDPLKFLCYGVETIQSLNLDGMTYLIKR